MQSHVVCQVKGECKYHDFIGWLVSFWISSAQLPIRPNPKGPINRIGWYLLRGEVQGIRILELA